MEPNGIQVSFFQHLKSQLPPHLSLVDEIADLLNISNDSAYRRIRAEKPISFEELQKISVHYHLSLDQFLHLQNDSFVFSGKLAASSDTFYEEWINKLLQDLSFMNTFEQKHLYYLTKDIPFITFFQFPELASFKSFFWMKSILNYEGLKGKKFSVSNSIRGFEDKYKKIVGLYNQIPATEIWNTESVNTTIRQIEFYRESNVFESKEDSELLYDKLDELISHIEMQAETGKKFIAGENVSANAAGFNMFNNEVVIGDNTCLADLGKIKLTYLNHSVINFITTRDERFNNYIYQSIMNLIHKSTQISVVGEKDRSRFFNKLHEEIHAGKNGLLH
jgi:ribosome-associated translation inhibitor RaiA